MTWWQRIRRTESEDWFFAYLPEEPAPEPLVPEKCYVNAHLTAMRVAEVRVGTRRYHAAVTSRFALETRHGGREEFVTVTTPTMLREADPTNLDRVVVADKRLLGPLPYRGGDLTGELGLFSVPSADLVEPYLTLVEEITSIAGVSLVGAAGKLVDTAKNALDLLFGASDQPTLEVGVVANLAERRTGHHCVIRAPRDRADLAGIRLGAGGRLDHADGSPVREPYLVFRVTASRERPDWASIPDVRARYDEVRSAVRDGDVPRAEAAVLTFGRTAVTSPDLLADDGVRLRALVRAEAAKAFPETGTSAGDEPELPELAELSLYG